MHHRRVTGGMTFEVFMSRVKKLRNGCWGWTGFHTTNGYAAYKHSGQQRVHRWLWEHVHKMRLGKWHVRHTCDNRGCVNPDHIIRGTAKQNVHDAIKRNRRRVLTSEQASNMAHSRVSSWNKGKKTSVSTRKKLSLAGLGRKHSQETIQRMKISAVVREQRFKQDGMVRVKDQNGRFK